ncbi:hypothetical protein M9H77_09890 [Catharanthus roseus]|uniref:Uncharacterized protein n=1 Tax=Catharanthus roseus TaxID=4058 RepID=A0ACC0C223_CATRO|nr:hypothetical protein M9H77_09890 [Catharanthus roseus]
MRRSSPSSTALYLGFLVFFLTISSAVANHHDQLKIHSQSWNTISTIKNPPGICYQLQRIRHCPPFPPSPTPSDHDIDPRYGVEKRLVPSGPNPLHN